MDEARALEGLGHLQAGVLELIAAARAFLDVVEDVVRDPATGAAVVSAVSAVARAVGDLGGPAGSPAGRSTERIPVGRSTERIPVGRGDGAATPGTRAARGPAPSAVDGVATPGTRAARGPAPSAVVGVATPGTRAARGAAPPAGDDTERPDDATATRPDGTAPSAGRSATGDAIPPGPRRRSRAQGVQRIQVS